MPTRTDLAQTAAGELRVELRAQKRRRHELLRAVVVALTALLAYERRHGDEPEALAALVEQYQPK